MIGYCSRISRGEKSSLTDLSTILKEHLLCSKRIGFIISILVCVSFRLSIVTVIICAFPVNENTIIFYYSKKRKFGVQWVVASTKLNNKCSHEDGAINWFRRFEESRFNLANILYSVA